MDWTSGAAGPYHPRCVFIHYLEAPMAGISYIYVTRLALHVLTETRSPINTSASQKSQHCHSDVDLGPRNADGDKEINKGCGRAPGTPAIRTHKRHNFGTSA